MKLDKFINRPVPVSYTHLISGCCIWGGETTTFSVAFSNLINSSNTKEILVLSLFRAPAAGVLPMKRGGVSS